MWSLLPMAARGLLVIHEWPVLIGHEGAARVLIKTEPRVCNQGMDDLDCCDSSSRPCHARDSELIALGTTEAGDRYCSLLCFED